MKGEIDELLSKVVKHMSKAFDERERVDDDMADAVKDLSEAAYHCALVEQMGGAEGYRRQQAGYMPMGYYDDRMEGYRDARGRYARGYEDPVEAVRDIMAMATPEQMERIKAELRSK